MLEAPFLVSLCLAALACLSDAQSTKKIVCYYSSWATYRNGLGRFTSEDIDPNLCDYYIYAFAGLAADYNVLVMDNWLSQSPQDGGGLGDFYKFTGIKNKNPKAKLLIGIGGWNEDSTRYSRMVSSPKNREIFINSVLAFVAKYGFDGINLDWHYPANRGGLKSDKQNFSTLLMELRSAFDQKGYILGIAGGGNPEIIISSYDIPQVTKYAHFVSLITYDYFGPWDGIVAMNAPLYPKASMYIFHRNLNQNYSVNEWIRLGGNASKLFLGIPTYGRSFVLNDPNQHAVGERSIGAGKRGPYTQQDGFLGYNEIIEKFRNENGWVVEWEEEQKVPYARNGYSWFGYDNEESVQLKAEFAIQKGLAGAMIWSLETDDFHGLSGRINPLINTVRETFEGKSHTTHSNTPKPGSTTPTPGRLECTKEGSFQHPQNCKQFYTCIKQNNGFQMIVKDCPDGLAFDNNIKACNWLEAVTDCN